MRERSYKTAWFAKAARKARLSDRELLAAAAAIAAGQADDLGGGVFKKRLGDNRQRAIVLAKSGEFWVFVYLFAKKDRANIDEGGLAAFRALANLYRRKTETDIATELMTGALLEIVDDREA
jgi:hypothetical protein